MLENIFIKDYNLGHNKGFLNGFFAIEELLHVFICLGKSETEIEITKKILSIKIDIISFKI